MTIEKWQYDDFVKANSGKFSNLDFIHAVMAKIALPQDFLLCIGRLFSPRVVMFDGILIAEDWFDEAKYREYRSAGMTAEDAQAWANMVEITGVFEGISFGKAKDLAMLIESMWNEKISQSFPGQRPLASVILEDDLEEVFVTIGRFSGTRYASV